MHQNHQPNINLPASIKDQPTKLQELKEKSQDKNFLVCQSCGEQIKALQIADHQLECQARSIIQLQDNPECQEHSNSQISDQILSDQIERNDPIITNITFAQQLASNYYSTLQMKVHQELSSFGITNHNLDMAKNHPNYINYLTTIHQLMHSHSLFHQFNQQKSSQNTQIFSNKYKKLNKDHTCVICLSDIKDQQLVSHLVCSHIFHEACVKEWLKSSMTCPLCKCCQA